MSFKDSKYELAEEAKKRGLSARLVACPFCSCDEIGLARYAMDKREPVWMAFCGNGVCSARVISSQKAIAIKKWNRRGGN